MLDESSVYQYSAVSKTWEVFVKNTVIDFATTESAGVVQIGDGIDVDENGVISVDVENIGNADWDQSVINGVGYIKNRTHYSGSEYLTSFDNIDLTDAFVDAQENYPYSDFLYNGSHSNEEKYYTVTHPEYYDKLIADYADDDESNLNTNGNLQLVDTYAVKLSDEAPKTLREFKALTFNIYDYSWKNNIITGIPIGNSYYTNGNYQNTDMRTYAYKVGNVATKERYEITDVDSEEATDFLLSCEYKYLDDRGDSITVSSRGAICAVKEGGYYNLVCGFEPGIYGVVRVQWVNPWKNKRIHRVTLAYSLDGTFGGYSYISDEDYVKKLEWKYLPEDLPDKQWVLDNLVSSEQSDWEETDAVEPSYIKNKPFGVVPIIDAYNKATTKEEKAALIANASANEIYTYADATYVYVGDDFQSGKVVADNIKTVKYIMSDDPDTVIDSGMGVATKIDDITYYFNLDNEYARFITIDENTSTNKRGIYMFVNSNVESKIPLHIWSSMTYNKTILSDVTDIGWTGTLAEYQAIRDTLDEGTKVFITDDETDLIDLTLNGDILTDTSNFYAPTVSGEEGQVLVSNGDGKEPIWDKCSVSSAAFQACLDSASSTKKSDIFKTIPLVGAGEIFGYTTNPNIITNEGVAKRAGNYMIFWNFGLRRYVNEDDTSYANVIVKCSDNSQEVSFETDGFGISYFAPVCLKSIAYANIGDKILPQYKPTTDGSIYISTYTYVAVYIG